MDRSRFRKRKKGAGAFPALLLLLVAVATMVLGQGQPVWLSPDQALKRSKPCTCHPGIEQIENFMRETTDALNAWKIVYENAEKSPMTPDQARAEWRKFHKSEVDDQLLGCNMTGVVGMTTGGFFGCNVRIRQDYADCACNVIVASTIQHEEEHCFENRIGWITTNPGKALAGSEIAAHQTQMEYLQEQLDSLRKKCQPKLSWYGQPVAPNGGGPAFAAASRVQQYAATI